MTNVDLPPHEHEDRETCPICAEICAQLLVRAFREDDVDLGNVFGLTAKQMMRICLSAAVLLSKEVPNLTETQQAKLLFSTFAKTYMDA